MTKVQHTLEIALIETISNSETASLTNKWTYKVIEPEEGSMTPPVVGDKRPKPKRPKKRKLPFNFTIKLGDREFEVREI
jgi:hypothetical protein